MKYFFGALVTETNTFSSIPTNRQSFEEARGDDALRRESILTLFVRHFAQRAQERGAALEIGLCATAQPSGPMAQRDYEELRGALLADLRAAGTVDAPLDAVFLMLHGAMVSEHCLDCEGDILEHVRAVVGPHVPVLAVLDPHAHLSQRMIATADVLSFMKEYPHTDGARCIDDLLGIADGMLRDAVRPAAAVADCRIVGLWPTQQQPIRRFVDRLRELEGTAGILSISFVHGFPWGDTPDTGTKVLVYTDGDPIAAQSWADRLAAEVWAIRGASQLQLTGIDAALDAVAAAPPGPNPIVLADVADNAGGGASADASFILRAVLERGLTGVAFALFYDPILVEQCRRAGIGARVRARVGGKLGPYSGEPVDVDGVVRGLATGGMQLAFGQSPDPMGDTAWIETRGIDIVLSSVRTQCFHPQAFTHIGLDPLARRALVVKSLNHFHAGFAPIAREVIAVATPGALNTDFAHLPYRVFNKPYWPRVERPSGP
jgi:microcystin degradation protein MlrC